MTSLLEFDTLRPCQPGQRYCYNPTTLILARVTYVTAGRGDHAYLTRDLKFLSWVPVMEQVMSKMRQTQSEAADFWSMSYRGHDIAVQRHYTGWLVYLNEVMQQGVVFAEAHSAANWLRRKVDEKMIAPI